MITYSQALSTLQTLSGIQSTDTNNSALLIQFWNDSRRTVASIRSGNWPWLEIQRTVDTVANQDYIYIPNDMRKVTGIRAVVGTGTSATIYLPRLLFDTQKWEVALAMRLGSNQYPYYAYQQAQQIKFAPTPSVTGTHIILIGRRNIKDVNIADVTNVTVTTATTDSTALVVSGSMTADMVGRYIRITETTAANGGDGYWYEIGAYTDANNISLLKPYQGTSIVAGTAACTIGQITYEPEAYQMAPIYRAVAQFWDFKEDMVLSERYWRLYDGGVEIGKATLVAGLIGQMLEEAGETMEGAYMPPSDRDFQGLFSAPYYYPWQDASGFN